MVKESRQMNEDFIIQLVFYHYQNQLYNTFQHRVQITWVGHIDEASTSNSGS